MKTLLAFAAVAAVVVTNVATSWAQTNILSQVDITIKGKLSPSGQVVTGADLAGNTNAISILDLQIISGTTTNEEEWVGQVVGSNTNLFLQRKASVDFTPTSATGHKFVALLVENGQVGTSTSSNAVLLLTGSSKSVGTNTVVSGKITGIWEDESDSSGGEAIAGSFANVKLKN